MSELCYTMKNASPSEGEIYIYEEIGEGGIFDPAGITGKSFGEDLKALGKVSKITCRINSPGGSVFDGKAIYSLLKAHPAKVRMCVDGLAASIASLICMAGDTIEMSDCSTMMIHDAATMTFGNATDLRKTADVLQQQSEDIARTYVKRTNIDYDKVRELMQAETWMTAEDCVKYGFADKVTDGGPKSKNCFGDAVMLTKFKKLHYRNVPQAIVEVVNLDPERNKRLQENCNAAKAALTKINLENQRNTR